MAEDEKLKREAEGAESTDGREAGADRAERGGQNEADATEEKVE